MYGYRHKLLNSASYNTVAFAADLNRSLAVQGSKKFRNKRTRRAAAGVLGASALALTALMAAPQPAKAASQPSAAVRSSTQPTGIQQASAQKPASPVAAPAGSSHRFTAQEQMTLIQKIKATCGGSIQDVQMQCQGTDDCTIQLTVRTKAAGQEAATKIRSMQEMKPVKDRVKFVVLIKS